MAQVERSAGNSDTQVGSHFSVERQLKTLRGGAGSSRHKGGNSLVFKPCSELSGPMPAAVRTVAVGGYVGYLSARACRRLPPVISFFLLFIIYF